MDKDEAMDLVSEFYDNDLNFCLCGTPHNVHHFIRETMRHVKRKHDDSTKTWKEFNDIYQKSLTITQISSDMLYGIQDFALYILDNINVIEHGSSIGGAWLTDKGEKILQAYELLNDDDMRLLDNYEVIK